MTSQTKYDITIENYPFAGEGFKISREIKTVAQVVKIAINHEGKTGIGECVPLKCYNYTAESVAAQLEDFCRHDPTLQSLPLLPAGPARFALDTALTHLAAQQHGISPRRFLGIKETPRPILTAFTLSIDTPEKMAAMAQERLAFTTLKMKIGNDGLNIDRLAAISAVAPNAQFILDANEALTPETFEKLLSDLSSYPVILIEQPLPTGADEFLRGFESPIPIAADESCHTVADLLELKEKYHVVNIKLDKAGGLHHALRMAEQAIEMNFDIMIGCMGSTSLSLWPAYLLALACNAKYVDLDGAALLVDDPYKYVTYENGHVVLAPEFGL
ncbi:MAG TPA: dipeptide epimerase [Alphaproteobacteria bacterium]